MQMTPVQKAELMDAIRVLFGPGWAAGGLPPHDLDAASIREAFRKRAFETHPDLFVHTGEPLSPFIERFRELARAYETVLGYSREQAGFSWPRPSGKRAGQERKHTGTPRANACEIPARRLLIGQYLYYAGRISRADLGLALARQKMGRPLIGRIALEWNWLGPEDIREILLAGRPGEKFGSTAERIGLLAPHQTATLVGRQRVLQPKLGECFTRAGVLDRSQVDSALCDLSQHNRRFSR